MERIKELTARMKVIYDAQAEIERRSDLENEGRFTEESRAEYMAFDAEFQTLKAEKDLLEGDLKLKASRQGRATDLQPAVIERRTLPGSSAPAVEIGTPTAPIDRGNDGPPSLTPKFSIPARAKRFGTVKNFHGTIDNRAPDERAYRFGMWALNRISQCIPSFSFPEATRFVNHMIMNTAHGENDGTTGGHVLVPEEFSSDLIILREKYGTARRLLSRKPMMSDTLHVPKRASGLTAYFVGESAAGTESNMTWQDVQLIAKDITILSRMSNQLSADAAISVGDELAGEMSYAMANKEDDCAFNGDGSSTYGGIQGIRNLLTSIDGAGADSAGVVTQATSNTWAAMVLGDFHNVVGKLPQFADTDNACWVCHRTFYASVMQKLEAAAGGNTIQSLAEGDRRQRPLFLGYPVEFSQIFPSATATSGVMVILGDLTLSSVFGDRQQTAIAFSEHATVGTESVFERNQIAIRGTERFDINNHGCGTASVVGAVVGLQTS